MRTSVFAAFALMLCWTGFLPAQQPQTPALPSGVKAIRNLEYVPGGHPRQKLDLYLPEKDSGSLPLIIFIHGGGWRQGSKDGCPWRSLATQGYAVARIGYRLSQDAVFPAQIEDCKAALQLWSPEAK